MDYGLQASVDVQERAEPAGSEGGGAEHVGVTRHDPRDLVKHLRGSEAADGRKPGRKACDREARQSREENAEEVTIPRCDGHQGPLSGPSLRCCCSRAGDRCSSGLDK